MENQLKEYIRKNYIRKDVIREAIKQGMSEAKGFGEEGGADIMAKFILVAMGDLDARTLDNRTI